MIDEMPLNITHFKKNKKQNYFYPVLSESQKKKKNYVQELFWICAVTLAEWPQHIWKDYTE